MTSLLLPQQAAAQDRAANTPQRAEIGTQVDFTFDRPLLEGRGVRSLRELRGKPVLIEFWGRN